MRVVYAPIPNGIALVIVSDSGNVLKWREIIELWLSNSDFQTLFDGLFQLIPNGIWETSPLAGFHVPFIMFLIHKTTHAIDEPSWLRTLARSTINLVTSPENTGILVVPGSGYPSLDTFALQASPAVRREFYQTLGTLAQQYLESKVLCWITTNGSPYGWTHVKFNEDFDVLIPVVNAHLSYNLTPWLHLAKTLFPLLDFTLEDSTTTS